MPEQYRIEISTVDLSGHIITAFDITRNLKLGERNYLEQELN
jgi:hypothetical protein